MATDKKQVEIPGRLHSVATEGVVAGANEILDDNKGKNQQEINASVDDSLQENKTNIANEITRATNAENAIKGGSSKSIQNLDSRLSTVEAHDTISMDGGSVVVGTAEDFTNRTTAGDAKIPTVGAILNGADEEPIAGSDNLVKSGGVKNELALGAVYDVSAKNPTAGPNSDGKWESLSALLSDANLNTLIPTAVRKGGMSIKFVQSSDNNYVQFRYMSSSTAVADFTNTANWQGVNDKPNAGSMDLASGKGTYFAINDVNSRIGCLAPIDLKYGRIANDDIVTETNYTNRSITLFFDVSSLRGKSLVLEHDTSYDCRYAFLISDTWQNGSSPDFCSGTTSSKISRNIANVTVPDDANLLSITDNFFYSNSQHSLYSRVLIKDKLLQQTREISNDALLNTTKLKAFNESEGFDCEYGKWLAIDGAISTWAETFVTPFIPFSATSLTVQSNRPGSTYIVLYDSQKSNPVGYTLSANQKRTIAGITDKAFARCCFVMSDTAECYLYDNTNAKYLWYGYHENDKIIKEGITTVSSNEIKNRIANIVMTSGSVIAYKMSTTQYNDSVVFPQTCAIVYNRTSYQFSEETTITLTHDNGFIVFNPNATNNNNGCKDVNYNYNLIGNEVILFAYSTVYRRLYIPDNWYYYMGIPYIGKLTKELVAIRDIIASVRTKSRVSGATDILMLNWFSDLHGEAQRIKEMKRFLTNFGTSFGIDNTISTGDQVQINFESDFSFWAEVGANNYLQVIGNHEIRDTNNQDTHTAAEAYQRYFADYISGWGVVSAGVNLCYYYKDYTAKKIRLIVLDCMHYDTAQNTWFASILADAKTNGLSVIAVSHYRADVPDYIECTFTSLYRGTGATLDSSACATVQNFIDGGGNFICWLGGHTHYDVVYKCHNYPQQLGFIICTMADNQQDNEHKARTGRFGLLFQFIAFNITEKLVTIIRPICNMDRWCRKQNTLVVNYETGVVVYND